LALILLLAACQSNAPAEVHIYTSFPLQGPKIGKSVADGVQLAFNELNQQMIGSKRMVLISKDDGDANGQWSPEKEAAIAEEAIQDPQTVAYIGPLNSGAAKVSLPITNRAGLLQISPTTTWPGLTKPGYAQGEPGIFYPTGVRTFFRTTPTDEIQSLAAAQWAKALHFKSFYTLDDGETYGAGISSLFARAAENAGLKNLGRRTIDKTAQDYRAILAEVKAANPDLVYFGGTVANGAGRLLKQMRALGITASFMGPDAIVDTTLIDEAGPAAEGVYATFVGIPPSQLTSEEGRSFYKKYKTRYGVEPEAFAQYGYDAGRAVIEAIGKAPVADRAGVLKALQATSVFSGTSGSFVFSSTGDTNVKQVSGNVVRNGAFQFVDVLMAQ
jgi:branched-chain amino acid transport system substrate-binding protein